MEEISTQVRFGESIIEVIPYSSVASHEVDLHEEVIQPVIFYDELSFHISSLFSMSSNMDSEVHMPIYSHPVHTSLDDGALHYDLLDVFLAISRFECVLPLTNLGPVLVFNSYLIPGTYSQSFHEDPEHLYSLLSCHTYATKDHISVIALEDDHSSHEFIDV